MTEVQAAVDYAHLINWFFFTLVSVVGGGVLKSLHSLVTNVSKLNEQIAMILERSMHHERQLEEHSNRIQYLERKV